MKIAKIWDHKTQFWIQLYNEQQVDKHPKYVVSVEVNKFFQQ